MILIDIADFLRIDAPENDILMIVCEHLRERGAPAASTKHCNFHSLTFFLAMIRIGVPSKSKDCLS